MIIYCLQQLTTITCTIFIKPTTYTLGVSQYIDILQYTKNLYGIAIPNPYRNISCFFCLLIKLFIFHLILVLQQLQVHKVYTCHIYTRSPYSHVCMYIILILLPKATFTPDSRPTPDQCRPILMAWSGMIG